MIKQLIQHRPLWLVTAFLSISLIFLFAGCDDPGNSDLSVFELAAEYPLPAIALDVSASGGVASVADNTAGTYVLDVTSLSSIHTLFIDTVGSHSIGNQVSGFSTKTAIDAIHHYVITGTDGTDSVNHFFRVTNYDTGVYVDSLNFIGPMEDFMAVSVNDTIKVWGDDGSFGSGFVGNILCRSGESSPWSADCGFNFSPYIVPRHPNHSSRIMLHGFGRRDDGTFALALDEWGIHICDELGTAYANITTRGTAYDCAWAGNYIVVADEVVVTLVDATDLAHPVIVSSLIIPSADRLEKVVVSYPYACVMDVFDGIYVIDISNPQSMKIVQLLSLSQPTSLVFDNGRLYVSDEARGLVIFQR